MGIIIFNGIPSTDFGLQVETPPNYIAADKDYESIDIPGRNGSLHIDHNRFNNVERSYEVSFAKPGWNYEKQYSSVASAIGAWLGSVKGYARLEDTYESNYYRIARYVDSIDFDNYYGIAGKGTITFDCQPERFLKSGEKAIITSSGIELFNPTKFSARPRIEIIGTGTCHLYIGSNLVTIKLGSYTSAIFDSYYREVYSGSNDLSGSTTIIGDDFPVIPPGRINIGFNGSGITQLKITPNWWTI